MIVALDMQLAVGKSTGIGEYVTGLAGALSECGVTVVELCERTLDPWRFDRRVAWDQVLLPQRARRSGADLLHCASGTMPLFAPLPAVVTVHDVAWLKVQAHARPYARYYFGSFSLHRYSRAAAIVVDSEFSRTELAGVMRVPLERVHVVYPGVAQDYCSLERRPSGERTILIPGTVERRKNLETIVRALALLPADVRAICVGPQTPYLAECMQLAGQLGVTERLEYRGYVPRSELLQLYAACALVAVPSRYEGFGYAAAQALCAGTPVIASDAAALTEVIAGTAPIVPADAPDRWAREIERALAEREEQERRAQGRRAAAIERFAWSAGARAMRGVYETVLRSPR